MIVSLFQAEELLKNGHVVAVPTETVYGLAASLQKPSAIAQIFSLKGRPSNNPLIIHVANLDQIYPFTGSLDDLTVRLAQSFWPGPMTLVLPIDVEKVPDMVRAGLNTAAFRIPSHPVTKALLERVGPIVMPSANISGRPSATNPLHVATDFGDSFPVLDGGCSNKGVESTILVYSDVWKIIRLGALPPEAFLEILGYIPEIEKCKTGQAPLCPGQMYRHYAPKAKLYFGLTEGMMEAVIGFRDRDYARAKKVFVLGSSQSPETVAENLYSVLRQLDEEGICEAYVDSDFPRHGLWMTIYERLCKAALIL